MKKITLATTIALALTTSAFAKIPQWYVGAEYATGSGDRTYDADAGNIAVGFNSSAIGLKVGKITDKFDKMEFQINMKTLENKNNASDKDDVMEYKFNGVISILSLSYKEIVIPYFEGAVGYGDSDNYGGQLATHLGLGIMYNPPIEHVEISAGYRLSTSIGSTDNYITYSDQHGNLVIGAAYKF